MADTRLTKIGPFRAVVLCVFAGFCPRRLVEAEHDDEMSRNRLPQPPPPEEHRAIRVKRALWASLAWVLGSIALGYFCGKVLGRISGPGPAWMLAALQIFGATVLLWATLFVRGWDIQSWGGVTLTERVNRFIYRLLYCFGTAAIVASLVLP